MILDNLFHHVFDYLLHQSIYASLIFIFVLAASILLRKKSPACQLALWTLVLLRLVLPPNVSHPLSLRNLAQGHFPIKLTATELSANSYGEERMALSPLVEKTPLAASFLTRWQKSLVILWGFGCFIFLMRFFIHRWQWIHVMKKAENVFESTYLSTLNEWKIRFAIKRKVSLKSSDKILTPFTIGLWRPVIVMPVRILKTWNHELAESIFAHELAHIKRLDDLWIVLQKLIQTPYFFHPAVWFTNHKLYIARECMCDSLVLAQEKIDRSTYGQGLITSLKSTFWDFESAGVLAAFFSQQKVAKTRINNLKKGHTMKIPLVLKILFIGFAIIVLPMAGQSNQSGEKSMHPLASNASQTTTELTFVNPLPTGSYKISSTYGEQKHPITQELRFHRAVDLAAKEGTSVYASADGFITAAVAEHEDSNASGKYVEIQHANGFVTRYTQLHVVDVKEGQSVKQGEQIGQVGSSGLSTGPHLHFEIWKDGQSVNPQDYIDF